jgi:hypothetical protein
VGSFGVVRCVASQLYIVPLCTVPIPSVAVYAVNCPTATSRQYRSSSKQLIKMVLDSDTILD